MFPQQMNTTVHSAHDNCTSTDRDGDRDDNLTPDKHHGHSSDGGINTTGTSGILCEGASVQSLRYCPPDRDRVSTQGSLTTSRTSSMLSEGAFFLSQRHCPPDQDRVSTRHAKMTTNKQRRHRTNGTNNNDYGHTIHNHDTNGNISQAITQNGLSSTPMTATTPSQRPHAQQSGTSPERQRQPAQFQSTGGGTYTVHVSQH